MTDSLYFNNLANIDDGSVYGCTSSNYEEYNPDANTNDGSCNTIKLLDVQIFFL